ncbi:hypothetical protein EVAR_86325_1 [Eumeta japonica]|uniref:Uncharacterized protein n=1 Tax=Eumeta variegata TaxID=151549 RepID=A0A4C1X4T8_EUMVA|nr:hypothetical protein EVAR_86325_1 [Eumeta japonica]
MGLRRLITEFPWPPSSSIIRLWLPYSTKVLVKTNQTSPNSMGLRRLITEFLWPPSSSIIRLWLPYSTKRGFELTPGSGPQRTPRRGAAGSDANSPRYPRLPRVRKTSGNYTVEVAPDAHGDQRRPSRVRVCCRTRAPCAARRAPRYAPRPGPAC